MRPALRQFAEARQFVIGAAVDIDAHRADPQYGRVLAAQYNGVVAENVMKFARIHPRPSTYAFGDADEIVAFAEANGMAVHGHTLVWHEALPAWLTDRTFTRDQLLAVLHEHITTVVGRYRGRVATWDVVNEVVADDNVLLRSSLWLEVIGPDYIDSAFVWAHRADPAARLFLNDWGEADATRASTILSLVQGLAAKGVPIHGVGFECHVTTQWPPPDLIRENLTRFANTGLDVRMSELAVRIPDSAGPSELAEQAAVYRDILDACLVMEQCIGFTTWGFTDRYSWIPSHAPGLGRALPFSAAYKGKPAYYSMLARLMHP
jgi:endo-1,4-beta-xylanase